MALPLGAAPDVASIGVQLVVLWRIVLAAALGAALGLERSIAGKHAGMRTYAMVSAGSATFVIISTLASFKLSEFSGVNPLQVASNVVLGVGFLGTGLAVFRGEHPVELTTAAGLWVAAGIGMAAGFGFPILAFGIALIAVLILTLLLDIENDVRTRYTHEPALLSGKPAVRSIKKRPTIRRQAKPKEVQ